MENLRKIEKKFQTNLNYSLEDIHYCITSNFLTKKQNLTCLKGIFVQFVLFIWRFVNNNNNFFSYLQFMSIQFLGF